MLILLNLYVKLPFGSFDQSQPVIRDVANRMQRTPGSVAMKLCNLASLDPALRERGRNGLSGASDLDRQIWEEFSQNREGFAPLSEQVFRQLFGAGDDDEVDVVKGVGVRVANQEKAIYEGPTAGLAEARICDQSLKTGIEISNNSHLTGTKDLMTANKTTPLTFDVDANTLEKIDALQTAGRYRSVSAVMRAALDAFDFSEFRPTDSPHRQISIRIAHDQKQELRQTARKTGVSLGELLRSAVLDMADRMLDGTIESGGSPSSMSSGAFPVTPRAPLEPSAVKITKTDYNGETLLTFVGEDFSAFACSVEHLQILQANWSKVERYLRKRNNLPSSGATEKTWENSSQKDEAQIGAQEDPNNWKI